MNSLRLKIGPVVANALEVRARVERDLPTHPGLKRLAEGVAAAAEEAERAAIRLRRPFGVHRLPVFFLILALLVLVVWTYRQFLMTTTLRVALPDRDARELRQRVDQDKERLRFIPILVSGSTEAVEKIVARKVDIGFVQGGIEIPDKLPRVETPNPEIVLWYLRSLHSDLSSVRRVITSVEQADSHTVAQAFMKAWKLDRQIEYVHDWKRLSEDPDYVIPEDIDAVFVVKDPADEKTLIAAERLAAAGFRLVSPNLGARAAYLDYLRPRTIPTGFLHTITPVPAEPVETYEVATYLVAGERMTPRMLAEANQLLKGRHSSFAEGQYNPTLSEASEVFQGVDAFLGIIINLVLAFLALTGWELTAYRKRFHELNSLISLISIHQSSKDVIVSDPRLQSEHILYLSLCSDLLGLVSMIGGYYTQENSSLFFSGLPEIIHQRCDGLKINIQLKILHATIKTVPLKEPVEAAKSEQKTT